MHHKTYEFVKTKQTLNKVKAARMPFDWSINPYRGCTHGCSFCYARGFQAFIGLGAEDEFQNHIRIKENAAEALEAQLARVSRRIGGEPWKVGHSIGFVNIGTVTDPYQPIEGKQQITRQCLKVLAKYQVSTSITTRSPLILRDMDILVGIPHVSINISVNTLHVGIVKKLEPATSCPIKRLETINTLNSNGIRAGVFIAPILPMITDAVEDLDALFAAAKAHQSAFAMASVLRLSGDVKPWYYQTLQAHFPQIVSAYNKLFNGGAYATKQYVDDIHIKTNQLMHKYELVNDVRVNTRHDQHIHETTRTKQVEVEQLSFDF